MQMKIRHVPPNNFTCVLFILTFFFFSKVSVCLMVFFIGGLIESQLISTGAFEITFNGMLLNY